MINRSYYVGGDVSKGYSFCFFSVSSVFCAVIFFKISIAESLKESLNKGAACDIMLS